VEGPRGVKPEEFEEMRQLIKDVFKNDLIPKVPLLYKLNELENLRILKEDGKIVTHIGISIRDVSILGCKTKVGSIGSVCTHPDYRQRGFATMVLEDVMNKLETDEVTVMSVSGGRGLYIRAGCRYVGKRMVFAINRNDIERILPLPVDIVSYEKDKHLKEIASFYQNEAVRFWRPLEDFEIRFVLANIMSICQDDKCIGYLEFGISKNEDNDKMRGQIGEFAGSRVAIISAIKQLFEKYPIEELSIGIIPQDTELFLIFKNLGLKPRVTSLGNTMRIINLPLLIQHFRPYIRQKLSTKVADQFFVGKENGKHFFQFQDEKFFVVDEGKLVEMVLGTPDESEQSIMPMGNKLGEVLKTIFPIPFVIPGLNNV